MSLVFLKDVIGTSPIDMPEVLIAAWIAWGASTLLVLLSYHFSNLTIRVGIAQLDRGQAYSGPFGGWYAGCSQWLNVVGAVLFVVGVVLITIFASANLSARGSTNGKSPTAGAASAATSAASTR